MSITPISTLQKNQINSVQTKPRTLTTQKFSKSGLNTEFKLIDFMEMLAKANRHAVSFGSGQEYARPGWAFNEFRIKVPKDGTYLYDETRSNIQFEAANRINNFYPWPQIDTINAWMVSAETDHFMSIGGLAKVAVDLPNSFNKRFTGKKDKMTILTPLYLDGKTNKIEFDGNKARYTAKNSVITLDKLTDLNVEIFDEWSYGGEMKPRKVSVYKGIMDNGTPYIMFYEPEIFNINKDEASEKSRAKNQNCSGCYVTNRFGYDENIRFAFFSKCVYELAKKLRSQPAKNGEKAPNIMIMNDWHVGSLAPMLKYLSMAEGEKGEISPAVSKYFHTIPTLFIAHNLGYQGEIGPWDEFGDCEATRTKVLGTLFGKYTKTIIENSKTHDLLPAEDKNTFFKYNKLNAGMMGLALADRIVPVSVNYGEELLASSDIANGMQNLLKLRNGHNTFTPITNGYSKSIVAPTKANFDGWLKQVEKDLSIDTKYETKTDDIKLLPYTITNMEKVRKENKKQIFKLLNRIIERERNSEEAHYHSLDTTKSQRRYMLYKPFDTDLSDIKDPSKVPVMTFVGRVADQKGMDTNFKKAIIDFARAFTDDQKLPAELRKYNGWEVPVTIIGGTIAEMPSYKELEDLKNRLREINPKFADRMLLFKGYANTNLLAAGTDFFLIPSNFEPCGLIQMEVMAKGVIPIATATGGLVSTIRDTYDGFLSSVFFDRKDPQDMFKNNGGRIIYAGKNMKDLPSTNWKGFEEAMEKALYTYFKLPNRLVRMQKTAMEKDFSWDAEGGALDRYVTLMKTGKYRNADRTSYFDQPDQKNKRPFPPAKHN